MAQMKIENLQNKIDHGEFFILILKWFCKFISSANFIIIRISAEYLNFCRPLKRLHFLKASAVFENFCWFLKLLQIYNTSTDFAENLKCNFWSRSSVTGHDRATRRDYHATRTKWEHWRWKCRHRWYWKFKT